MIKFVGVLTGAALLAALVYFAWFSGSGGDVQPQAESESGMGSTVSPRGDSPPRATPSADGRAEATADAISEAHSLAMQGELEKAMALVGPHAAAGDAEALAVMGELNVQRHVNNRQERIAYLVKRLSEVPEENTAQRYAIMRELAKLSPENADFVVLRELYGELFVDELEEGLLLGQ